MDARQGQAPSISDHTALTHVYRIAIDHGILARLESGGQ
jgi:hypothetical protein